MLTKHEKGHEMKVEGIDEESELHKTETILVRSRFSISYLTKVVKSQSFKRDEGVFFFAGYLYYLLSRYVMKLSAHTISENVEGALIATSFQYWY